MAVKIVDNTRKVINTVDRGMAVAVRQMGTDIRKAARPITPRLSGQLSKNVTIRGQIGGTAITWQMSYAAAQEAGRIRGRPIRNYTTPGTGAGYARRAVDAVTKRADMYFKGYIR